MMLETALIKAQEIVRRSEKIIAFTGAGISTESGVPDFRSPGGLWTRFNPEIYANYHVFLKNPKYYWELEREVTKIVERASPNPAHLALTELERRGKLISIITQNIDLLHQRAGSAVPIFELHGTPTRGHCVVCLKSYTRQQILTKMKSEPVPRCEKCDGAVKPDVVLFYEDLPYKIMDAAQEAVNDCDCLLLIGCSLSVYPANQFPIVAKKNGAKLIFVNLDPTPFDEIADVCIIGKAGEIIPLLLEKSAANG